MADAARLLEQPPAQFLPFAQMIVGRKRALRQSGE
jgi:hypothetical protein